MEKHTMTCEEFQLASLDFDSPGKDGPLRQAAREHLHECPHCAAFQHSWLDLQSELRGLAAKNQTDEAPSRVEMRLRQEFRTKHKSFKARRNALIGAWALATAAAGILTIGSINWRQEKNGTVVNRQSPAQQLRPVSSSKVPPAGPELGEVLVASNDSGEFTLLPSSMPGFLGDATVVHVQMQRGALGALGLTVNEEHAGDWIQVDLLVGDDGQPQAVRLPQSTN